MSEYFCPLSYCTLLRISAGGASGFALRLDIHSASEYIDIRGVLRCSILPYHKPTSIYKDAGSPVALALLDIPKLMLCPYDLNKMAQTIICTKTSADSICRFIKVELIMPCQATITPGDVDIRWPFRAGYPRLPRPPVWTSVILDEAEKPISDANFEQLQSRIDAILEAYDIPCARRSHELAYRRSPISMLLRVTVDCIYDKEASPSAM